MERRKEKKFDCFKSISFWKEDAVSLFISELEPKRSQIILSKTDPKRQKQLFQIFSLKAPFCEGVIHSALNVQ